MCDYLNFEEESKKARAFQREKRQELQLILSRCNEIGFNYICVPKEKAALCFGSAQPRKIPLVPLKTSDMNSFMRKVTKEYFPEPESVALQKKNTIDEDSSNPTVKPSYIFASKVVRFQETPIISTGRKRRKKIERKTIPIEPQKISFGASKSRDYALSKSVNYKLDILPGIGMYHKSNYSNENSLTQQSFGGKVKIKQSINIICSIYNNENCNGCEAIPKNIYWRHIKTNRILCRDCMSNELKTVKKNAQSYLERLRKLESFKYYEVNSSLDFCDLSAQIILNFSFVLEISELLQFRS